MFDNKKRVYRFGGKTAEGDGHMRELLGGKGANLAEMSKLGMPVPAGFTITTECCAEYYSLGGGYTEELKRDVAEAMKATETIMGKKFGDPSDPLLVSCRSGARSSMPGMMDTILNIGLCSETIAGMIQKTGNPRFVYDAYRRLIMMYSDVVMEKAEGIEPEDGQGIRQQLDRMMMDLKEAKGYKSDTDITAEELKDLCEKFKAKVKDVLGVEFPDTAQDQLWGSIGGVFKSWNGKRAIAYRRIEKIPDDWGTAVNVQSMVFGNMGNTSATGVAFSRNPANGDNKFYGEWLINAQGEDVVAGIRTPNPLNEATKTEKNKDLESLECAMPEVYKELDGIRLALEKHFQDMQDIEFTIQEGHLWMLQCRIGKRTGLAALQMAMDMVEEKMIDEKTAVMRVSPAQLDEILHPILDPASEKKAKVLAMGLPASPGGAVGQIVFTSEAAMEAAAGNRKAILIREETSPEDIEGMRAAAGILTTRGGMTSHAALVARGWGKCCIVGCESMKINFAQKTVSFGDIVLKEGDWMSLNGTKGLVYGEQIATMDASENPLFVKFMATVDKFRKLGVRTNADTPEDVKQNWEKLKLKEKGGKKRVLSGVPDALPALIKAQRIQEKAHSVGFDWDNKEEVWQKVNEEIGEFTEEIKKGNKDNIEAEFGDIIFSLVNLARHYDINPENALERTNKKFISRFNYVEEKTLQQGKNLKDMTLDEMDQLWNEAKKNKIQ